MKVPQPGVEKPFRARSFHFRRFFCKSVFGQQKNLLKRRRLIRHEKRNKHKIIGAIVDLELTTVHHLRKRKWSAKWCPLVVYVFTTTRSLSSVF